MDLPRSTYYYQPRDKTGKEREDTGLRDRMEQLALRFPRYGYRRMTAQLQREGLKVNHKRVLRIMRESDLLCKTRRRYVRTTDSNHTCPVYPNLYQGRTATGINQVWVADITYIRLPTDFVYLSAILDTYSRKVVGWSLSRRIDAELTCAALQVAIASRWPSRGCIHHSDRGVQYASRAYTDLLREHGFRISMSRKGNPYENARMESFFKTLKSEEVYLGEYRSFKEASQRISEFIERVYNEERLHSALGYVSPVEFELNTKQAHRSVLTSQEICPA
jgi:putative transposase